MWVSATLVILKLTGSGFEGYPKCGHTTCATSFRATWYFTSAPASYRESDDAILAAMLVFAESYSPSAQTTLFQMGEVALPACAEIVRIDLGMPNKHCLLINLSAFGLENEKRALSSGR